MSLTCKSKFSNRTSEDFQVSKFYNFLINRMKLDHYKTTLPPIIKNTNILNCDLHLLGCNNVSNIMVIL